MEQVILYLIKNHGLAGVVIIYLLWDRFYKPWDKKKNGDWVDYRDIKHNRKDIEEMLQKIERIEVKQSTTDVLMASIQAQQLSDSKLRDDQMNHIFNQLGSIFSQIESVNQNLLDLSREMRQRNGH